MIRKYSFILFLFCVTIGTTNRSFALSHDELILEANSLSSPQIRFKAPLNDLSKILFSSNDLSKVSFNLVNSPLARPAAFSLQGLAKIYKDQDSKFSELKENAKILEDALGEYDKWNGALKKAKTLSLPSSKIAALQKNVDTSFLKIKETLKENSYIHPTKSPLVNFEKFIENYDFGSENKDQKMIEKELRKQLEDVFTDYGNFDLSRLERNGPGENRKGLHELRRNIRWFSIEAASTKGAISFLPVTETCPSSQYKKYIQSPLLEQFLKNPYAQLTTPSPEILTCKISRCLFYRLVDVISELGVLKEQAETENLINDPTGKTDTVPSDIAIKAKKVLKDIQQNQPFEMLAAELKTCQKSR